MAVKFISNDAKEVLPRKNSLPEARPKARYKPLQDLPYVQYLEIENMLLSGESPNLVARHVRGKWGALMDVKEESVIMMLKRFKRDVIVPKLALSAGLIRTDKGRAALAKSTATLDIAVELDELCAMQKKRITKIMEHESKMPLLFDWVNKELRLYKDILRDFAMLKLETGMLSRIKDGSPLMQVNIMNGMEKYQMDVDRGQQLAYVTQKMLGLLSENVIDVSND